MLALFHILLEASRRRFLFPHLSMPEEADSACPECPGPLLACGHCPPQTQKQKSQKRPQIDVPWSPSSLEL